MATEEEISNVIDRCAQQLAAVSATERELARHVHLTGEEAITLVRRRLEMDRMSVDFQEALGIMKRGGRVRRRDWDEDTYLKGHDGIVCMFICRQNMLAAPKPWEPQGGFSLGNKVWVEI